MSFTCPTNGLIFLGRGPSPQMFESNRPAPRPHYWVIFWFLLRDILAGDGTEAINIFFLLHLGFFSIEGERDKKKKAKKEYYDVWNDSTRAEGIKV